MLEPSKHTSRNVFLTGATGFVGSRVLTQLLASGHTVYALCRKKKEPDLITVKKGLGQLHDRLHILVGDLTHGNCGLGAEQYMQLSEMTDTVVHSAFYVNHLFSAETMTKINLRPLQDLLRFCMQPRAKGLLFVSALSSVPSRDGNEAFQEVVDSNYFDLVTGGYSKSKWLCEQEIYREVKNGLRAAIVRPGLLSGHQLGEERFLVKDHFTSWLQSCLDLKMVPEGEVYLHIQPVDTLVQLIVKIVGDIERHNGVYHVTHERPFRYDECAQFLRTIDADVAVVGNSFWLDALRKHNFCRLKPFQSLYEGSTESIFPVLKSHPGANSRTRALGIPLIELNEALESYRPFLTHREVLQ